MTGCLMLGCVRGIKSCTLKPKLARYCAVFRSHEMVTVVGSKGIVLKHMIGDGRLGSQLLLKARGPENG
jgi:hypothetical protein